MLINKLKNIYTNFTAFIRFIASIFTQAIKQKGGKSTLVLWNFAIISVFCVILIPAPIVAKNNTVKTKVKTLINAIDGPAGKLPKNTDLESKQESFHYITAYNSEIGQCDASPCITANGFDVCEHGIEDTIAANFLPLGTKVKIPDLFDEKVFVVRDRMNARYTNRVDIWLKNKSEAKSFGVKYQKIEILEQE